MQDIDSLEKAKQLTKIELDDYIRYYHNGIAGCDDSIAIHMNKIQSLSSRNPSSIRIRRESEVWITNELLIKRDYEDSLRYCLLARYPNPARRKLWELRHNFA